MDNNGWIVVSKDPSQTGQFFGKVRILIIKILVMSARKSSAYTAPGFENQPLSPLYFTKKLNAFYA